MVRGLPIQSAGQEVLDRDGRERVVWEAVADVEDLDPDKTPILIPTRAVPKEILLSGMIAPTPITVRRYLTPIRH